MKRGFTIIELLVVVTIIVVLLALLVPSMDKAIYQSELAVCGTRLKAIGTSSTTYAMDNRRYYPYRQLTDSGWQPALVNRGDGGRFFVDRLRMAFPDDGPLHCPLSGETDLYPSRATETFSSYNLWFSWNYNNQMGMARIGDRWHWNEQGVDPRLYKYSVLASDRDNILAPHGQFSEAQSSHPDVNDHVMSQIVVNDGPDPFWYTLGVPEGASPETITIAMWRSETTPERGIVDDNFCYADGSVIRINGVQWNRDERMGRVGTFRGDSTAATAWLYVPRN